MKVDNLLYFFNYFLTIKSPPLTLALYIENDTYRLPEGSQMKPRILANTLAICLITKEQYYSAILRAEQLSIAMPDRRENVHHIAK